MPVSLADARAVVFDLDGTLVDSLDDIARELEAALAQHGLPLPDRAKISEWVGYGAEHLVRCAVPDPARVPVVLDAFRAHYAARPVIDTHLYAGIAGALDALAPGRALAVLSNKPHDMTVAVCDMLLARWRLAAVAGDRPGRPKKPDPGALLAVLGPLRCAPSEAVLVGDSEVDVATARAAGVRSVAVAWGLRSVDVLRAAGPDHLVASPAELATLFAG